MEPTTFWTAFTGIATALAAIVAIVALLGVRRDSAAQTRPYLQAQVVPSVGSTHGADLIIRNTGRTAAHRVHIEADQWPSHDDLVIRELRTLFSWDHAIAPGATLRTFWALHLSDIVDPETGELDEACDPSKDPSGFTSPTNLTLTYDGKPGRKSKKRQYSDTYDIRLFGKGMTPLGAQGISVENDSVKTVSKKLGELIRAVNMTRWNN